LGKELVLTVKARGFALWVQRLVVDPSDPRVEVRADLTPARSSSAGDATATPGAGNPGSPEDSAERKASPHRRGSKKKATRSGHGNTAKVTESRTGTDRTLLLVTVLPWAEVWVNGNKVGHTPRQFEVEPGKYEIELRNADYGYKKTFRRTLTKGMKLKIKDTIQPPPDAPSPQSPQAGAAPPDPQAPAQR
jgi:hypothetical protein